MIEKCSICKRVRTTNEHNIWQPWREQWPIDEPKEIVATICHTCKKTPVLNKIIVLGVLLFGVVLVLKFR